VIAISNLQKYFSAGRRFGGSSNKNACISDDSHRMMMRVIYRLINSASSSVQYVLYSLR